MIRDRLTNFLGSYGLNRPGCCACATRREFPYLQSKDMRLLVGTSWKIILPLSILLCDSFDASFFVILFDSSLLSHDSEL